MFKNFECLFENYKVNFYKNYAKLIFVLKKWGTFKKHQKKVPFTHPSNRFWFFQQNHKKVMFIPR